ncbi:MAG: prepilin-type N-terminal cleavage/methylation domain-containing protein [Candidatus Riflebacteria bacterium]|nr:prepilin-type N-terminal cleavage/methylation domain-containing protein [Candidatus Riflebacteria bacterium]
MRRRGFTVIEVLVALVIASVVLSAVLGLWSAGSRMSASARGSASLAGAMLIEETILRDLRELGIDPRLHDMLLLNDGELSFYKVAFVGEDVRLRPVKYERLESSPGTFLLRRTELLPGGVRSPRTFSQVPLGELSFSLIKDRSFGNRYLRVDFATLDAATPTASGRVRSHSLVVRIPIPSQLGDPRLQSSMRLMPDAALLPLAGVGNWPLSDKKEQR